MSKDDTQHALVPRLRFPEFRDYPGWRIQRLGDALSFQPGHPFPSSGFNETGEGLRLIRNRDLRSDDAVVYYSSSYDEEFVVNDGDVLIGMDGDFTPCVWNKGRSLLNQRVGRITPNGKNSLQFLRYFLTAHLKDIEDATPRTTVKHLSHSDVEGIHEPLPEPAEQQKIAGCLGSLDDLIASEGRKLAALRDHKKGLMQQLFPREGETQPRLRFPEFRNAGEWEVRPLGDVADIKLGKMLDKNRYRSGHLLPYLNNLAVRWNDFDTSELSEMYFDDHELEKYELVTGDVVVCEGGEPGRSAVWDERLPDMKFQKALHRVRFNIEFAPHLLVHYLETIAGTSDFESSFTGGGIKHLTRETFARMTIPIASFEEQHRIADCLSALDALIAAQAEKLDALRTHKRGLMQQLFPSPEES